MKLGQSIVLQISWGNRNLLFWFMISCSLVDLYMFTKKFIQSCSYDLWGNEKDEWINIH